MDRVEKQRIIELGKGEFEEFLVSDNMGKVLELLDEEGISLIKNDRRHITIEDRINYILSFSRYRNEVFKNEKFLELFFMSDVNDYYNCLSHLNDETYELLIKYCLDHEEYKDVFATMVSFFNNYYLLNLVQNWPYDFDYLYSLVRTYDSDIVKAILNKNDFDLSSDKLNLEAFLGVIKENNNKSYLARINGEEPADITIPASKINADLYRRIWNNNVFAMREIISDCEYCFDTDGLNSFVEKKEEELISSYNPDTLLGDYTEIYEAFYARVRAGEIEAGAFRENNVPALAQNEEYITLRSRANMFNRLISRQSKTINNELEPFYRSNDIQGMYNCLKKKSDQLLSDYIIDYHFKENFHNVMIDIKELLNLVHTGKTDIPEDRISLYERILNIDNLSVEEKKALHNELKSINMVETFYDDMLYSRRLVSELLKESSLSRESISSFRDDALSNEYGVDVYNMEGQDFFAIVKTGRKLDDMLPTGHSFSIVGRGGIGVFGDPKYSDTFVYDASELNPDQVVHMFPFDSFTMYKPFAFNVKPSERVNMLMRPDELIYQTINYNKTQFNELLLLEKGNREMDMDSSIPRLRQIALFCVDEIRSQDVEKAREMGVGIVLVSSKDYRKENGMESQYRENIDYWNENYYSSLEEEKFEARR